MSSKANPRVPVQKRESFIPFSPPQITEAEIDLVVEVLKSPWITTGPKTRQLESEFCERYGAPAALALNSCTAGLHLSLLVHGIGPGDEVIVPTHTFCATANVVEHVGARPVLVDVDDDTLNIDPIDVRAKITERTKAVMPVHFAGHPVDLDSIVKICEEFGLHLIEDAAHPVSAKYRGKYIGSRQNLAAFSFYATKNLTSAEGGILTGSKDLIDRARVLSLHGMDRDAYKRFDKGGSWRYDVAEPGFKYNMPDILAALALGQMNRLEEMQDRRRQIVARYLEGLAEVEGLRLPTTRPEVETSNHLFVIRVTSEFPVNRDHLIKFLADHNVGSSVHYTPIHRHSFYRSKYELDPQDFPIADKAFEEILSLPLSPAHTDEEIDYVIDVIKSL